MLAMEAGNIELFDDLMHFNSIVRVPRSMYILAMLRSRKLTLESLIGCRCRGLVSSGADGLVA